MFTFVVAVCGFHTDCIVPGTLKSVKLYNMVRKTSDWGYSWGGMISIPPQLKRILTVRNSLINSMSARKSHNYVKVTGNSYMSA